MVVMAHYFNPISGQVDSVFLSSSEVPDASAAGLFSSLEAVLQENELPFTTLVGFATDGASLMRGRHNSVTQRARVKQPTLFDLHCPCHAAALIASSASGAIPDYVAQLCHDIFAHSIWVLRGYVPTKSFKHSVTLSHTKFWSFVRHAGLVLGK